MSSVAGYLDLLNFLRAMSEDWPRTPELFALLRAPESQQDVEWIRGSEGQALTRLGEDTRFFDAALERAQSKPDESLLNALVSYLQVGDPEWLGQRQTGGRGSVRRRLPAVQVSPRDRNFPDHLLADFVQGKLTVAQLNRLIQLLRAQDKTQSLAHLAEKKQEGYTYDDLLDYAGPVLLMIYPDRSEVRLRVSANEEEELRLLYVNLMFPHFAETWAGQDLGWRRVPELPGKDFSTISQQSARVGQAFDEWLAALHLLEVLEQLKATSHAVDPDFVVRALHEPGLVAQAARVARTFPRLWPEVLLRVSASAGLWLDSNWYTVFALMHDSLWSQVPENTGEAGEGALFRSREAMIASRDFAHRSTRLAGEKWRPLEETASSILQRASDQQRYVLSRRFVAHSPRDAPSFGIGECGGGGDCFFHSIARAVDYVPQLALAVAAAAKELEPKSPEQRMLRFREFTARQLTTATLAGFWRDVGTMSPAEPAHKCRKQHEAAEQQAECLRALMRRAGGYQGDEGALRLLVNSPEFRDARAGILVVRVADQWAGYVPRGVDPLPLDYTYLLLVQTPGHWQIGGYGDGYLWPRVPALRPYQRGYAQVVDMFANANLANE